MMMMLLKSTPFHPFEVSHSSGLEYRDNMVTLQIPERMQNLSITNAHNRELLSSKTRTTYVQFHHEALDYGPQTCF